MSDNEFWLRFWALVGTVTIIIAIIMGICFYANHTRLIENGYEQVAVPGAVRPIWQKIR